MYERFRVKTADGSLLVGAWGSGERVVVGAHGITGNHVSFLALADELGDEVRLVVPDLRGRAGSRAIEGPFSMANHADDLASVLDHVGAERALLVGHSMGGFVSVVMAHRHPDRVAGVVLVDGGLPLDLGAAAELPVDQLITAVIGPAAERLRMTFASKDAYFDYWRQHPALTGAWGPYVEEYLEHDLVGEPPELRPSCLIEALHGDTESQLQRDDVSHALDGLRHSTVLLRAPRGIFDADPLYSRDWAEQWEAKLPSLRLHDLDDVNHYTVLLAQRGAAQVAAVVREELAAT